jgi:hypothetical protein
MSSANAVSLAMALFCFCLVPLNVAMYQRYKDSSAPIVGVFLSAAAASYNLWAGLT